MCVCVCACVRACVRAGLCAEGFVVVGSAVQCAPLRALMPVNGPESPLDKVRFACLYRAIHVKVFANII